MSDIKWRVRRTKCTRFSEKPVLLRCPTPSPKTEAADFEGNQFYIFFLRKIAFISMAQVFTTKQYSKKRKKVNNENRVSKK